MGQSAKIFISSVAEDTLKDLRENMFSAFLELGHNPQMYEKTFGPWGSDKDGIETCLEKVQECEIYCLLIGQKGGTLVESLQRTVTHLEFIKAMECKRYSIVFCEKSVKQNYFKKVSPLINEYVEAYKIHEHRNPQLEEILTHLKNNKKVELGSLNTDYYVWIFLYDIIKNKNVYIEDLKLGVTIDWKNYLSDILRKGVELIPFKKGYEQSYKLANELLDFKIFIDKVFKLVDVNKVTNWNRFLALIRNNLKQVQVKQTFGHTCEAIGRIKNCTAICLYHHENQTLKCNIFEGDTEGNSQFELTNSGSIVVSTYNDGSEENLYVYFQEDLHIFYCLFKVREYVIVYDFEVTDEWTYNLFSNHIENVVESMYAENAIIFDLVNTIIRRLKS
ncbi:MAG: DUF4062 domain-containing protein [Cellulosilyticaceae bacterium]